MREEYTYLQQTVAFHKKWKKNCRSGNRRLGKLTGCSDRCSKAKCVSPYKERILESRVIPLVTYSA